MSAHTLGVSLRLIQGRKCIFRFHSTVGIATKKQKVLEEISNAVEAFKSEVAAAGYIGGRLIKKDGD
jgi:hypothetical protein